MAPAMFQNSREGYEEPLPESLSGGVQKIGSEKPANWAERAQNVIGPRTFALRDKIGNRKVPTPRTRVAQGLSSRLRLPTVGGAGVEHALLELRERFFFKCDFSHNWPGSRGTSIMAEKLHFINQNDRGRPIVKIRAICSI